MVLEMKKYIEPFGTPNEITSDNGHEFCRRQVNYLPAKYEITHKLTATYNPRVKGQTKRLYAEMVGMFVDNATCSLENDRHLGIKSFSQSNREHGKQLVDVDEVSDCNSTLFDAEVMSIF